MQTDKGQWGAKTPIKWKIFGYLLVFVGFLLVLLWLLQVVFLDSIYKEIKTKQILEAAKSISTNIDHPELPTLLESISKQHGICVRVLDDSGEDLYSVGDIPECLIHKMDRREVINFYHQALVENGTVFRFFSIDNGETVREKIDRMRRDDGQTVQEKDDVRGNFPPFLRRAMMEQMVYAQIADSEEQGRCMILLNATITPVQAVVETLRIELWWVSGILVGLSILLAFFMARKVSAPIMKMNASAKELAQGNYDTVFSGDGYLEIAELNDTLNHTAKELAKVEGLRKELIANVSHDLRTPLTMITGYGEVMRDIPGENTPENVQIIIDEARRLTDLVNDMLDLSKLQEGVHTLHKEEFNLTQCIREILTRYGKLVEQEGYQIIFEPGEEVWVNADRVKIEQVIYNLVNNSINYTGADKKVEICQTAAANQVRIDILDCGPGIAQEQMPYIWERYYRTEHSHQRAVVGTGLGLSIVKNIFDLHGMAYGVENRATGGCDFWFVIEIKGG
ncbi:MAG: HAMP domain-containing histidine kinase [Peptococcaceae bacterium]|nr:HAMP domain-containing histidine kinase [Peptococcaceae bacterium]